MKKIPGRIKIPIRIQAPQMCARNRQKSFLPEKNLQAEMSRSLSRTHVDRVTITELVRRRLSADKCRGTPMWIGLSSQVLRGRVSETWAHNRYPPRMRMLSRSWIPSRRSDHPSRGLSVVSSPQLLRDEDLFRGRFPSGGNEERKTDNSDSSLTNHCVCAESPNKIYGTPGRRVMPMQVEEKCCVKIVIELFIFQFSMDLINHHQKPWSHSFSPSPKPVLGSRIPRH